MNCSPIFYSNLLPLQEILPIKLPSTHKLFVHKTKMNEGQQNKSLCLTKYNNIRSMKTYFWLGEWVSNLYHRFSKSWILRERLITNCAYKNDGGWINQKQWNGCMQSFQKSKWPSKIWSSSFVFFKRDIDLENLFAQKKSKQKFDDLDFN